MLVIKQIGFPFAVVRLCLSRVCLQTELDSTQSYYHYLKVVVRRISYHDLARRHRITQPRDVRSGKRTWEVSTARSMMNNGCLDWFSLFQVFRYTCSWNIVASGEWLALKNTE